MDLNHHVYSNTVKNDKSALVPTSWSLLFDFLINLTLSIVLLQFFRFPQSDKLSQERQAGVSCKSLFTFQNDQAPRHSVRAIRAELKCPLLANYRCFCVMRTFWTWFQIIVAWERLKAGWVQPFSPSSFLKPTQFHSKLKVSTSYHEKPSGEYWIFNKLKIQNLLEVKSCPIFPDFCSQVPVRLLLPTPLWESPIFPGSKNNHLFVCFWCYKNLLNFFRPSV